MNYKPHPLLELIVIQRGCEPNNDYTREPNPSSVTHEKPSCFVWRSKSLNNGYITRSIDPQWATLSVCRTPFIWLRRHPAAPLSHTLWLSFIIVNHTKKSSIHSVSPAKVSPSLSTVDSLLFTKSGSSGGPIYCVATFRAMGSRIPIIFAPPYPPKSSIPSLKPKLPTSHLLPSVRSFTP